MSETKETVSSRHPNTEKEVEYNAHWRIFDETGGFWMVNETLFECLIYHFNQNQN